MALVTRRLNPATLNRHLPGAPVYWSDIPLHRGDVQRNSITPKAAPAKPTLMKYCSMRA